METSSPRTRALTLLVTSLGSFMVLLDGSIVFVALPEIQRSLGTTISSLQWTVDAYTLPFAALMLTAGTLGDRLGRKRVFLVGLVLFIIGSALCGFAPGLGVLIVGRVVQGLGAGAINTGSLSLLVSTFTDPPGRAKAIGIWTAVSGVSIALGPLVGGVLIQSFNWHAIFLVNLPIGALALFFGVTRLIESKNPQARNLDVPGQVAAAGGLFCLVMGLIESERKGWGAPLVVGLLVAAAVLFGGFLLVELRSREPLLPLELFRNRTFGVACAIASVLGFVICGVMFFMAQYFQTVQGHTALQAGVRLLPLTLGIFFFSPPASRLAGRIGPRVPIIVGAVLVTGGFALLSTIAPATGFGAIWWKLAVVGAGIGLMFAPLTVAVMASTPPQRAGLGSSMINTTRITGFTAGAAVLGTIVLSQFRGNISNALTGLGLTAAKSNQIAGQIAGSGALAGSSGKAPKGLPVDPAQFTAAVNHSFVDAVHVAFYICAACTLLAAVVAAAFMTRGLLPETGAGPMPAPGAANGTADNAANGAVNGAPEAAVEALELPSALVETAWLAARLGRPGIVVVDCTAVHRPLPTGGVELESGLAGYRQGHIEGAVFADLLTEFADPDSPKPFTVPPVERLARAVEELGIGNDDLVVLYDRAHTAFATRLWWLLHYLGHDNAAVLNGGWKKWTDEGRPVDTQLPTVARSEFKPSPRPELFVTREQVQAVLEDPATCLVNALSADQHDGRVPVAHGRSGHIPSSVNVPAVTLVDPETGAFLPLPQLASSMEAVGATDAEQVIAYCAAGVNATSDAFVLKLLGVRSVAVYDGGLAEWSGDPALPLVVATA